MTLNVGMQHQVLEYFQICSNDDPELTFDLFYGKVKFDPLCFCMGKKVKLELSEDLTIAPL